MKAKALTAGGFEVLGYFTYFAYLNPLILFTIVNALLFFHSINIPSTQPPISLLVNKEQVLIGDEWDPSCTPWHGPRSWTSTK